MMVEKNATPSSSTSLVAVFIIFLRLGLTSFGGPIAHLGFFRNEFVERRRWVGDREYADLVALAQFLPGPASSEVGIALGLLKRGIAGAVAAWLGFTLPSAIGLVIFAFALTHAHLDTDGGAPHGLKVAAVAVVAQALWGMAVTLCPDRPRATMAIGAAVVSLTFPGVIGQLAAMLSAGVIGVLWLAPKASPPPVPF